MIIIFAVRLVLFRSSYVELSTGCPQLEWTVLKYKLVAQAKLRLLEPQVANCEAFGSIGRLDEETCVFAARLRDTFKTYLE